MNKKTRLLFRSLILLIIVCAVSYTIYKSLTKDDVATVGDQAPNFVLTDLNGHKVKLSDFKGKGVFLNFWGTWCEPCKQEMPDMEKLYSEYKKKGVEILAVNVGESNVAVKDFKSEYKLTFPIVNDKTGDVVEAYGIDPLPTTVLVDKNGKIIKKTSASLPYDTIKQFMEMIKP
ncbi:thiol-disulfide oxidoreductase ResA [Fictibacillus sp. Mic-4]|uniref:thiol-disulfide oxidoreductase ResA n=1 Tax=Fictibacillus TaxID=1329200 RepID=UPI0004078AD1|nr:thiol-disulfide oxidoreductase ResA [Fictibacillus gelatini]